MIKTLKSLTLGIILVLVVSMTVMIVASADYSGADATINWNIDVSERTLTISGSGSMPEYAKGEAPWYQYGNLVETIEVVPGVVVSKSAFYGMEKVESLYIPEISSYIGYIFGADTYFLNSQYLPSGLKFVEVTDATSIPAFAFNNAVGIEYVSLPVTEIVNASAFKDCSGLEKVFFGADLTSIAANAFLRCDALKAILYDGTSAAWGRVSNNSGVAISPICLGSSTLSITAPETSTYYLGEKLDLMGLSARFGGVDVTDLVELVLPDMTTVGTKRVDVVLGNAIESFEVYVIATESSDVSGVLTWSVNGSTLTISGNGMMDDYTLELLAPWYNYRDTINSVVVNEGVTSVGAYAFYGLDNVSEIVIPQSVETVGFAAFENCASLTNLEIKNAMAVVDGTAFRNCNGIVSEVSGAKYATVSGNATYALLEVDTAVESFTIPATTQVIAEGAFENCTALTSISVPDSVITIGDDAFAACTSLTDVTIGVGVKYIGNYAFADCSVLANIVINAIPDYVGAGAFAGTSITGTTDNDLVYLAAGDNLYAILWKTASDEITSSEVNANTKVIASLAFADSTLLESVTLPTGLLNIGDGAFNNCTKLYSIVLPDTVLNVGDNAFKNCTSLTSVDFSDNLKSIGNSAFRGAVALTEVIIDADVAVGYNAFRDCTALKLLAFNAGSIGYKAFANCIALKEVYLADAVLSIGDYAFMGCNTLQAIAIPETTAAIGFGALYGCDAIRDLAVPFIGEKVNGTNTSLSYIFGGVAPVTINKLIVGSDIKENAFEGIETIYTLVIDTSVTSVSELEFAPAIWETYYFGSAEQWANVTNSGEFANVKFANSMFDLEVEKKQFELGEFLSRGDFTATIDNLDFTSLLRFASNPIASEDYRLPAKLGSVVEYFKTQNIDDVQFTDYSLLLEGSIGFKFYVKLSEFAIDDIDNVEATIDYFGDTYNVALEKADNAVDSGLYTVKFYVAPKETKIPVTLNITYDGVTASVTRRVEDYVNYVNQNPEGYAECINLINEMYNYGEYSRYYFANGTITPNPDLSDVEVTIPSLYAPYKTGSVAGITFNGSSLLLESNTTVRHYFTVEDGAAIADYTFAVDGYVIQPEAKDGLYYIDIGNIIARNLGKLIKLDVMGGNEVMTIVYSPLSYAKNVLENNTIDDDELPVLVKALYRYYVAASDYFKYAIDEIVPDADESAPSIW